MTYGDIVGQLPIDARNVIRNKEKIEKKLCNNNLAISFNEICLRENLLPIYTKNIPGNRADNTNRQRWRTPSPEERRDYMRTRIREMKEMNKQLEDEASCALQLWNNCSTDDFPKEEVNRAFNRMMEAHEQAIISRNQRKLVNLNGGHMKYPRPLKGYTNLTDKSLTSDQEELLNFGLNCHIMKAPQKHCKRLECEILIDNVENLVRQNKVTVEPPFKTEVIAEASKLRGSFNSTILEKRHIEAAKQLKADPTITVRRADKASSYVLIYTNEYLQKLDQILGDENKFKKITRDPTESLKKKINDLVDKVNAVYDHTKLPKLSGDYGLGYCYGNVKTHKPGNKLRPIISQIPTPTYHIAKKLNEILTPYTPIGYSVNSPTSFLDLLANDNSIGPIASLDVESLFTNVPVDRTIQYILNRVYHNEDTPKCDIPEQIMKELLECCTKEAPFTCPRGNKYCQIDGVAMGSPLGVLFANFFMGSIEEETFRNHPKPLIYCRYIDDIFVKAEDSDQIENLRQLLMEASGLNFTIEHSDNGSLPFLDVLVKERQDGKFNTTVYVKDTNPGHCLNGISECPPRYKETTIGAYIRRALTHCNEWQSVHKEMERASQILINNGFANKDVERVTKKILDNWYNGQTINNQEQVNVNVIKIYYKSSFSTAYKEDERIMQQIIKRNVKPTQPNSKIDFIIYYQNKKTSNLLLKNNTRQTDDLQKSHVIYKYTCKFGDCATQPSTYIGMTTMKLSRRLSYHLSSGAPKNHHKNVHQAILDRETLDENTEILAINQDKRRLAILEALFIKELSPNLNTQALDLQALPSVKRSSLLGQTPDNPASGVAT